MAIKEDFFSKRAKYRLSLKRDREIVEKELSEPDLYLYLELDSNIELALYL